jgi:trigger factor
MSNAVEMLSPLERRIHLTVALDEVEQEVEDRLKRMVRTTKMPGFRPGKVPLKLVAKAYGPEIRVDVLNNKVGKAFSDAVAANQLRVAGLPQMQADNDGEGEKTLGFTATFEVYPEIKVGELAGVEIEKVTAEVSEAEIDKTIDILRKQRTQYQEQADKVAESGDRITLDFIGRIDGTAFPGGTAQGFAFVLGQKQMLPEFEAAATGMKAGETKTFPLSFPADYHGKDVAGKTAEFEITVGKVEAGVLPEVGAEFAKSLGVEDGDLAKMRADIRANLEREVNGRAQARTKENVLTALLKVSEFAVPKSLVDQEIQRLMQSAREDMQSRGMKLDGIPLPPDLFQSQAERRVRLGLILAELVDKNGLSADPNQVRAKIEEIAQNYEHPQEVVRWYYNDNNRLMEVEGAVLEDNVVQWALSQAKAVDKPAAFDDLMGNNR